MDVSRLHEKRYLSTHHHLLYTHFVYYNIIIVVAFTLRPFGRLSAHSRSRSLTFDCCASTTCIYSTIRAFGAIGTQCHYIPCRLNRLPSCNRARIFCTRRERARTMKQALEEQNKTTTTTTTTATTKKERQKRNENDKYCISFNKFCIRVNRNHFAMRSRACWRPGEHH